MQKLHDTLQAVADQKKVEKPKKNVCLKKRSWRRGVTHLATAIAESVISSVACEKIEVMYDA